jgi:AlwI restriction endonuclease
MSRRESQYKPLLLTTTMRNPERLRNFLLVLKSFDGKVLTNALCEQVEGELIRRGLYMPTRGITPTIKEKWYNLELLTDSEVSELMKLNPQLHKEAGFDYGWPSRFDTHYEFQMWLGFVYYEIGQKIEFSKLGNLYVEQTEINSESFFANDEQQIFLNAFARYHRRNPFQRVLNHNRPLILLIGALTELAKDSEWGGVGIARHELPFLIVWKDDDAAALAKFIIDFRKRWAFIPSNEVIFETCEAVQGGWNKAEKIATITRELPDEILRKFRMTGLISIRGNGRFISLNSEMRKVTEYLLSNYSTLETFATEREYFDYASQVDPFLIQEGTIQLRPSTDEDQQALENWINHFGVENIKRELINLSRGSASKDEVLRITPEPLRLEFLSALLLKHTYADSKVIANYKRGDDGLPISHAPGNYADIELYEKSALHLYEVTLMKGAAQAKAEVAPITRHLDEYMRGHDNVDTIFVAPNIHIDSIRWFEFQNDKGFRISSKSIEEFVAAP